MKALLILSILLFSVTISYSQKQKVGYLVCIEIDGELQCSKVETLKDVRSFISTFNSIDTEKELFKKGYFSKQIYVEKKRITKKGKFRKLRKKDMI